MALPARGDERRLAAVAAVLGSAIACGAAEPVAAAPQIGEWRFDEDGGQAVVDSGAHRLNGRLGLSDDVDAADPARIGGLSGGALHFDGRSYVRLPDRSELDPQSLTVESVVRAPASPGRWRYLVSRGGRDCFAGSYGLYTAAAGGIAVYVFDGNRYVVSATARPEDVWDGRWHHVGGTFDGRTVRLFVDGRPVGTTIETPLRIDYASTSAGAYFGRFVGDCSLEFGGDLDLVRMWADALPHAALHAAASRDLSGGGPPISLPGGPLPAADAPTTIPARPGTPGAPGAPGGSGQPGATPDTPRKACVLRLSKRRVKPKRRAVVRVRVRLRGRPARAARVVAKPPKRSRVLDADRTSRKGWARLEFDSSHLRRVRISAPKAAPCSPVYVKVARPR